MTTPIRVFTIALCVTLLGYLAGCNRTEAWRSEVEFEVVRERIYDNAPRTQVDQWLVVSGNLTRSNMRALLVARCDSLMARGTYSANDRPTNVFIYLFESSAGAERGGNGWIAMLAKQPGSEASIRYGALESESTEPSD